LLQDSLHDHLTGLPNRRLFLDRLDAALTLARTDEAVRPTLLLIDIDGFKDVNDLVGLAVGDSLLLTLARRMSRLLKAQDTLSRIGGDQFAVMILSEQDAGGVAALVESMRKVIATPNSFGERDVFLTASIGMALTDSTIDGRGTEMLRNAEIAMMHAKRLGGDRVETFRPAMRAQRTDRMAMEHDLRRALERNELTVAFQPIVRLADRTVAGFEALVRWNHPRLGMLLPGEFIPIAEETGLITELGMYVLDRTARELAAWQTALVVDPPLFASVNVSSRQLFRHDLLLDVKTVLSRTPVIRGTLRLEITESLMMENPELSAQIFVRLKDLGAGLSLDDFGTGYSSLAYLQRFPFDTLKIDKSLVRPDQRGVRPIILRSIVQMGHDLGMEIVAEGVETESDAVEMAQLGCEFAQGFAFGHPMSAADARKLVGAAAEAA
jgi:diguanylate cyclase (GGDEF)-like protein